MNRPDVFVALDGEREYQCKKWGDTDAHNNVGDFILYMEPDCGTSVAHDLVDHPFFGFAASCPLKARTGTVHPPRGAGLRWTRA